MHSAACSAIVWFFFSFWFAAYHAQCVDMLYPEMTCTALCGVVGLSLGCSIREPGWNVTRKEGTLMVARSKVNSFLEPSGRTWGIEYARFGSTFMKSFDCARSVVWSVQVSADLKMLRVSPRGYQRLPESLLPEPPPLPRGPLTCPFTSSVNWIYHGGVRTLEATYPPPPTISAGRKAKAR